MVKFGFKEKKRMLFFLEFGIIKAVAEQLHCSMLSAHFARLMFDVLLCHGRTDGMSVVLICFGLFYGLN